MTCPELEHLYEIFSRYPRPETLEGCPCCTLQEEGDKLCATPLREIDAAMIEKYAAKAMTTWGGREDFKYFLPRILELWETIDTYPDIEIVLDKIAYAKFSGWPDDEKKALEDYVIARWRTLLTAWDRTEEDSWELDSFLCGASSFLDDISPFLNLADAITQGDLKKNYQLFTTFWNEDSANYARVKQWIEGPRKNRKKTRKK